MGQLKYTTAKLQSLLEKSESASLKNSEVFGRYINKVMSILSGNSEQLIVSRGGDSFASLRMQYLPSVTNMARLKYFSVSGISNTFSGGAAKAAKNTNHQYWIDGSYYDIPAGGAVKINQSNVAITANEAVLFPLIRPDGGSFTVDLMNSSYSASYGQIAVDTDGELGAGIVGFFGCLLSISGESGDTFSLTYCNESTGSISWNSDANTLASNIQTALESLLIDGVSLSGLVSVTVDSGFKFRVIFKKTKTSPKISYSPVIGDATGTFTSEEYQLKVTGISGNSYIIPVALFVDRVNPYYVSFGLSSSGTQMSDMNQIDTSIFNTVMQYVDPDFFSLDQFVGQCDSESTYQTYIDMIVGAVPNADKLHVGWCPTGVVSDETTRSHREFSKAYSESKGFMYFDSLSYIPTWSSISQLGTYWTGDNTHAGEGFCRYLADAITGSLGLNLISNRRSIAEFSVDTGSVNSSSGLEFRKSRNDNPAGIIKAESTYGFELQFKVMTNNRGIQFLKYSDSAFAQFGSHDGVLPSFIPSPMRIGGITKPQLLSGSGSPEAVITAPIGSIYMRTDGGTNTSMYVKESGTGNTGWVAK